MRLAPFLRTSLVIGVAVGATIFACGGDDGGGGGNNTPDAKVFMDAPPPDMAAAMGIGQPCTPPMTGSGQGTCPDGYTCLALQGGGGAWCSKTCTRGSGDTCQQGYTGPGVAICLYTVQFGSGGPMADFCGVYCADNTGTCGSACNGTCPGTLTCSAPVGSAGSACK